MTPIRAWLLHWANSSPPCGARREFYAIKTRLLEKHGRKISEDVQRIEAPCWGRWGDFGCQGKDCDRCGGTGIWETKYSLLDKYEWGRFTFHVWRKRLYFAMPPLPTIRGVVKHHDYGRLSNESALWLFLLCGEWRTFWRCLRGWACHGRYLYPLTMLQRVMMPLCTYLRRRECYCGRRFWTRGSGWLVCKPCRTNSDPAFGGLEPPF